MILPQKPKQIPEPGTAGVSLRDDEDQRLAAHPAEPCSVWTSPMQSDPIEACHVSLPEEAAANKTPLVDVQSSHATRVNVTAVVRAKANAHATFAAAELDRGACHVNRVSRLPTRLQRGRDQ
jgi:hypothetical protein